ncbi:MAG: sugar porter family MFS transporter [Methanomassiliicoccus sp.]|nr:sugar porter family MFS transporter [Methanomassiliicoccus sp.]
MDSKGRKEPRSRYPMIVFVAAAVAAVGGILFGYDTGVISGAILFIVKDFDLSSSQESVAVSIVLVGAIIGAASGGYMADHLGRRRSIILASLMFLLGTIIVVASQGLDPFLVGRLFIGAAIGIASFICPMYISEVSPKGIRGSMVSLNQLMVTVGILLAYFVSLFFASSSDWQAMFLVGMVPAAVLLVGIFVMPNSPRWLVLKSRHDDAVKVIKRFHSPQDPDSEITDTINEMEAAVRKERGAKIKDLFTDKLRLATMIGVGLAILQQATGINTVIYYAPTIFQLAGFQGASASISASIWVGVTNVALTVVSIFLVDRIGRRPLLLISLTGMVIALLGLGISFQMISGGGDVGTITVALLMLYVASFAIGLGPVFWLLISEIYPLRARGQAMSLATVANWMANFVISLTFLGLIDLLTTGGVFLLYAIIGILAFVFIWKLVPETKGLSLEEIEKKIEAHEHHVPKEALHPKRIEGGK